MGNPKDSQCCIRNRRCLWTHSSAWIFTKYPCLPSSLLRHSQEATPDLLYQTSPLWSQHSCLCPAGHTVTALVSSSCHLCLRNKNINKPYTPIALHQFHLSCYFYELKILEKGPEEIMKTHRMYEMFLSAGAQARHWPQPDGLSQYIPADNGWLE